MAVGSIGLNPGTQLHDGVSQKSDRPVDTTFDRVKAVASCALTIGIGLYYGSHCFSMMSAYAAGDMRTFYIGVDNHEPAIILAACVAYSIKSIPVVVRMFQ